MARPDTSAYRTFDDITGRLDEIVADVRSKDTSLERSLDLFDEAIALGSKAVEMVDTTNFTEGERAKLAAKAQEGAETATGAGGAAPSEAAPQAQDERG